LHVAAAYVTVEPEPPDTPIARDQELNEHDVTLLPPPEQAESAVHDSTSESAGFCWSAANAVSIGSAAAFNVKTGADKALTLDAPLQVQPSVTVKL
jgi:hypothetical protein